MSTLINELYKPRKELKEGESEIGRLKKEEIAKI